MAEASTENVDAEGNESIEIGPEELPALFFLLLEQSSLSYEINFGVSDEEAAKFQQVEGKRFRKRLDLGGGDTVQCGSFEEDLPTMKDAYSATDTLIRVLRCHRLETGDLERLSKMATGVNLSLEFLPFRPKIRLKQKSKKIELHMGESWMFYAIAKAALRYEESFSARLGIERPGEPSLREEELAVVTTMQGYSREKTGEGAEDFVPDPLFEKLLEIVDDEQLLRGYVLFEILHQGYGVELRSLNPEHAAAVEAYLLSVVLKVRRTDSP